MYSFDPHRLLKHMQGATTSTEYAQHGKSDVYIKPLFDFSQCRGCGVTIAKNDGYCLRCSESVKN